MRRPSFRIATEVLTALSLLFCMGICVLWARSQAIRDELHTFDRRGVRWSLSSFNGHIGFDNVPEVRRQTARTRREWLVAEARRRKGNRQVVTGEPYPSPVAVSYAVPHAVPAAMAAALPAAWAASRLAARWRRWRRPKDHQCRSCRYDLTGNVSGTCPECGTPVVARRDAR